MNDVDAGSRARHRQPGARATVVVGRMFTARSSARGPAALYREVRPVIVTPEGVKTHAKVTVSFDGPLNRVLARMLPETDSALQNYVAAVRHRAELIDRAG